MRLSIVEGDPLGTGRRRNIMRTMYGLAALLVILMLALSGCGGGGTAPVPASPGSGEQAGAWDSASWDSSTWGQ